jgi:O-antigen/teichoic acid export membrane protein
MIDQGCQFVGRRVDEFVLGGIAGSATVGNYYMASEISALPTREVVNPAGRALLPTYAKVAHDEDGSRKAFLRVFGFVAIYALPAGVGISVVSPDLVPLLLGAQWTAAIPFFQWLGIYASFEAFLLGVRPYFLARGGERSFALVYVGYACVLVPAIVAAGHLFGVMAIAMTRTVLMAVMVVVILFVISRLRYAALGEMLSLLWRPLVASAVMWGGLHALPDMESAWRVVSLLRNVGAGGTLYVGTVILLWLLTGRSEGPEDIILRLAYRRTRRLLG